MSNLVCTVQLSVATPDYASVRWGGGGGAGGGGGGGSIPTNYNK